MNNLLTLLACHFIGDFPFQPDWMALNKGKSWEILFYHCLIYVATFVLFAHVSPLFAFILLVSHLIIDPLKARWKIVKSIWLDQLLHIVVILLCLLARI